MEPILNKKTVKMNYTNIFKQQNNTNKNVKKNEISNKKPETNHQKLYNRNLIIANNINNKQGINNNKTNKIKNYLNNIKNIYNKTNQGNISHNINRNIKVNNTTKNSNENKIIIKSNKIS